MMKHQRGISLIVVMIFLVLITSLGTFAIRRVLFGESAARNQLDVEVARQAAEAALRDAERDILIAGPGLLSGALCDRNTDRPIRQAYSEPNFGTNCPRGQCRADNMSYYTASNYASNTNPMPWWPGSTGKWNNNFGTKPPVGTNCSFTGGVALGTFTGTPALTGVARQPEYLIEYMQRGLDVYYRITARGWGLDTNSEVVVQSYFQRSTD